MTCRRSGVISCDCQACGAWAAYRVRISDMSEAGSVVGAPACHSNEGGERLQTPVWLASRCGFAELRQECITLCIGHRVIFVWTRWLHCCDYGAPVPQRAERSWMWVCTQQVATRGHCDWHFICKSSLHGETQALASVRDNFSVRAEFIGNGVRCRRFTSVREYRHGL